jgi:hypothetical protein
VTRPQARAIRAVDRPTGLPHTVDDVAPLDWATPHLAQGEPDEFGPSETSVGVPQDWALQPLAVPRLQRTIGNRAVTGLIQRRLRVTAKLAAGSATAPIEKVRIGDRPKFWKATDNYFTSLGRPRAADEDYRHIVDFETTKRSWEKGLVGKKPAEAYQTLTDGENDVRGRYPHGYVIPPRQAVGTKALDPIRALEELLKYVVKLEFNNPKNLWPGASGDNRSSGSSSRAAKQKLKKLDPKSKHRFGKAPTEKAPQLHFENFLTRLDLDPNGSEAKHWEQVVAFRTSTRAASRRPTSTALPPIWPSTTGTWSTRTRGTSAWTRPPTACSISPTTIRRTKLAPERRARISCCPSCAAWPVS